MFAIFSFGPLINYLLTELLVLYREILSPPFLTHGPRKLGKYFKASGLVFHGTALTFVEYNKYCIVLACFTDCYLTQPSYIFRA